MEQDPQSQFIKDRLEVLPPDLIKLIVSPELPRKINLLAKKYNLNDEQETVLQNEISFILLVIASLDELAIHLEEGLGVSLEKADLISQDVSNYILKGVNQYLAHTQDDLVPVDEEPQTTEQPSPVLPARQTPDTLSLSKEKILREVENPSRTFIKRYVIEYDHKPLQDTTHLLDDKVDETPKLQDHYEK